MKRQSLRGTAFISKLYFVTLHYFYSTLQKNYSKEERSSTCSAEDRLEKLEFAMMTVVWSFGRRVSFLAEGVKRDSEEAHLLKTVPSGGAWRSEDEGEETLLTSL